jgi:hypothetical protein
MQANAGDMEEAHPAVFEAHPGVIQAHPAVVDNIHPVIAAFSNVVRGLASGLSREGHPELYTMSM